MPQAGADPEMETAKQRLRDFGGFEWALTGQSHFKADEIEEHLRAMGWPVTRDTLSRWLTSAMPYLPLGNLGTMFKSEDVIKWLAGQIKDPRGSK